MGFELSALLKLMVEKGASDLHLTVGSPPALRVNGLVVRVKADPLTPEDVKALCYPLLDHRQREAFDREKEIDFAFGLQGIARCRANLFVQRGAVAAVFRRINNEIPDLHTLGFNKQICDIVKRPHGLVLVTGATGSGKSTSLAAFIDKINKTSRYHVVTIEDPIEYTHTHHTSIVNQRELGVDCLSFHRALRQVLREDPDVIMVGEMRDRETAESAMYAAETGHLVFSTLHTNGAIHSITRLVQLFPADHQDYIRLQLSFCLEAVISQNLIKRADRKGRVMVYEYLAMTPAVRNLIRENKLHQVYGHMQLGQENTGMSTMNQNLMTYLEQGVITLEDALNHSPDVEELERLISKSPRLKGRAA
jgi:twitching motility protein PilT